MTRQPSPSGLPATLWKRLTSIKLTVAVLLSIAAAAVIGTLIPQNRPPAYYQEHFGETIYPVLHRLNLTDMYHSLWFQALLLLLAVNIVACSLDRLKSVLKIVFTRDPGFTPNGFSQANAAEPITIDAPVDGLQKPFRRFLGRRFARTDEQEADNDLFLFAEKGRFSRLGVYIVHLSILVLLAGALMGARFGFDGYVNLPEGQATDQIQLTDSDQTRELGFTLRCDDFDVSFYDSGQPKEYRSRLTVLDGDNILLQKDIVVNKPLRFRGIGIFQSSYGIASAKNIEISFISRDSGMEYYRIVNLGEPVEIPEDLGTFTPVRLLNEYLFKGRHNIGQTLIGTLEREGERQMVALPLNFAGFDKMRQGKAIISVRGFDPVYFTGLQIRRDPGVGVVYTGFLLLIAGIYITFFLSHTKCCVRLTRAEGKTVMTVYCKANKNKPAARKKAQWLRERLAQLATRAVTA